MKKIKIRWNGGDARVQIEEKLLKMGLKFDLLQSPLQRASGRDSWLASLGTEMVAEISLKLCLQKFKPRCDNCKFKLNNIKG